MDDTDVADHVFGTDDPVKAAAVCAVAREIFEETGLFFVVGEKPSADEQQRLRRALLDGEPVFCSFLDQHGLKIDAEAFHPAGVFVTPRVQRIRFHARYYLVRQQEAAGEELIVGEIDALDWMRPADARKRWREGALELAPPVALVLKQLEQFELSESLRRLGELERFTSAPVHGFETCYGIFVLPMRTPTLPPATHTNCVVIGQSEFVVIDPGPKDPEEQASLLEQLNFLMGSGGRIQAILLTHGHGDHVGAAAMLREHYGAPVWAHEATRAKVECPIDRTLSDGETITIAGDPPWRLRAIYTPGHDPGHLAFVEETTRTLICGDIVAGRGSIVIPHGRGGDMTLYIESLQRLLEEDLRLMVPAHGFVDVPPKEKLREQLNHRLEREAKIQAALDSGANEIEELLASAYNDVPKSAWKLAESSLRAHLVRLGVTRFED